MLTVPEPDRQAQTSRTCVSPLIRSVVLSCALAAAQCGICFFASPVCAAETASQMPAPPLETLRIRGGEHKDYNRLVFDWPRETPWKVERNGDTVVIIFAKAARVDGLSAAQDLPHIRHISADVEHGKALVVKIVLAPHMAIHPFEDTPRFVLDISTAGKGDAQSKETPVASSAPPPADIKAQAAPVPAPQPAVQPSPAQNPPATQALESQDVKQEQNPVMTPAPAAPATGFALPDKPTVVATFDPQIEAAIALFVRGDYAYVVFDRKLGVAVDKINGAFAPNIAKIESVDAADTSVFRFAVSPDMDLRVGRNGTAWRILASKKTESFPLGLPIVPDPNFSLGGRLIVSVTNPGPAIAFQDPVVGDRLFVVPTHNPTEAVPIFRHYVDLDILPSVQGIVVDPRADDIRVRDMADGVEISTTQGLHLSTPKSGGGNAGSDLRMAGRIFDWDKWRQDTDHNTFTELRQRMQLDVVNAAVSDRDRARLDLARFYLANGYGYEAMGLLQLIAQALPDLAERPEFLALKAAAEIISDHAQAGLDDFNKSGLGEQDEGKLWRAVAFAKLRDWKDAAPIFTAERVELETYPKPFFKDFGLLAAESWAATNDYGLASNMLDQIVARSNDEALHDPKVLYLRGVVQSYNGNLNEAEKSWKEAAASNDRLPRTRAELALADLYLAQRKINADEASSRLERLRYAWRGDALEFEILQRLGMFENAAGRYSDALGTLHEAMELYPNNPDAPQVLDKMRQIFHDIFLTDLGKDMSPLKALTLYQQYKDLSPSDDESDKLALKIVEKLMDIDLLDQAAEILQAQMDKRAPGADKSHLGVQLAAIYLLNHQPDKAITAIDGSDAPNLDAKLQEQRKLLRARGLSDQGKQAEAMAALGDDNSVAGLRLKADAAWRAKDWQNAAKYLGQLVTLASASSSPSGAADAAKKNPDDSDLLKDKSKFILNLAITLALAHDMQGLDHIGHQFGDQMKGTPEDTAFELLTQPDTINGKLDMNDVQAQMANVDLFKNLLETYSKPLPATATP